MRAIAAASSGAAGLACTALPLRRRAAPSAAVDDGRPVPRPLLAPGEGTSADRANLLRQVAFLYVTHAAILKRSRREMGGRIPRRGDGVLPVGRRSPPPRRPHYGGLACRWS